ncbi:hypothetical protein SCOCK_270101 [Actinacidiphila cocklensis]|uniref:Uncharacterized protein n=1 Tax=Actinacidiphila cocklensis TaxID=887465 RepID=A0A9W4DN71_9ACTN|nr:hypothetical protein SCOCK_270101 [Actinacidiphila cocklensis]
MPLSETGVGDPQRHVADARHDAAGDRFGTDHRPRQRAADVAVHRPARTAHPVPAPRRRGIVRFTLRAVPQSPAGARRQLRHLAALPGSPEYDPV